MPIIIPMSKLHVSCVLQDQATAREYAMPDNLPVDQGNASQSYGSVMATKTVLILVMRLAVVSSASHDTDHAVALHTLTHNPLYMQVLSTVDLNDRALCMVYVWLLVLLM